MDRPGRVGDLHQALKIHFRGVQTQCRPDIVRFQKKTSGYPESAGNPRRVAQPGVVLRRQVQQAPLRELIGVLSKAAAAVRLRLQKRTVHFRTPRHN
jgi:hypothetical protein